MSYSTLMVIASLLELPTLLLLLVMVGITMTWTKWSQAGRLIASASAVALAAFTLTPAANLIARGLEDTYPPVALTQAPAGAIVVCDAIHVDIATSRKNSSLNSAAECLTEPATLAGRFPNMQLVYVADAASPEARKMQIAAARDNWQSLGIPESRMRFVSGAPDTRDNVARLAAIVPANQRKDWILVSSAMAMPRLAYVFNSQGFRIAPYPVDYRTAAGASAWFDGQNIRTVAMSSRELALGLALRYFGSHIERPEDAT